MPPEICSEMVRLMTKNYDEGHALEVDHIQGKKFSTPAYNDGAAFKKRQVDLTRRRYGPNRALAQFHVRAVSAGQEPFEGESLRSCPGVDELESWIPSFSMETPDSYFKYMTSPSGRASSYSANVSTGFTCYALTKTEIYLRRREYAAPSSTIPAKATEVSWEERIAMDEANAARKGYSVNYRDIHKAASEASASEDA
ncbi:hypothetical protein BGZ54_000780, partial [Gamsiella multidivaricata]